MQDISPMVRVEAGGVIVLLKVNVVTTADIRFSTTVSVSVQRPLECQRPFDTAD